MLKNNYGFAVVLIILGLAILAGSGTIFYSTVKGNPPKFLTELLPLSDKSFVEHTPIPELISVNITPSPTPCLKCGFQQNTLSPSPSPCGLKIKTATPKPTDPTNYIDEYKETTVNYESYEDINGNYIKDEGEGGISSTFELKINESETWRIVRTEITDSKGVFSFTLLQPGSYQLIPLGITFYRQPGPKYFDIDKNGGVKNFSFGYFPQTSKTGFKIFVFNDKNENGNKDTDEEFIHYQYAKITNLQGTSVGNLGTSWNIAVPETGAQETYLPFGEYKTELIPESDSWKNYFKITKQSDIAFLGSGEEQKIIYLGAHKLY